MVIQGKYLMAKKNAHNKMINCIKPYEAFHNKVLIFSSGEGNLYKYILS
jgi:hypothetical protein